MLSCKDLILAPKVSASSSALRTEWESAHRRSCRFEVPSRVSRERDRQDRSRPRGALEIARLGLEGIGFCLFHQMMMRCSLPWEKSRGDSVKLLEDSGL